MVNGYDKVFTTNATNRKPWLSIDLGALMNVTQIVYHNHRRDGNYSSCSGLEFRIGGAAVVSAATAAVQMKLNEVIYRVPPVSAASPSALSATNGGSCSSSPAVVSFDDEGDDGVRITLDLECPRVGRYITLQNAGGGGNTAPTLLQVSELQVFGEPEGGITYGNDAASLSTLLVADEGACCRSCSSSDECLYWDFQRSSGACRLKGMASALSPSPDGKLPTLALDVDRVAGSRRGALHCVASSPVGVFTRHPLFSYSHDKPTRWIWSRPDAASNAPPRDVMTHLFRSYHSTMAVNATMKVIADDYASVSVNGVLTEPQRTWPFAAVVPLALQQGHNLIVLHCRNFGGAAMAAAAVFATDGNNNTVVLLRTDHTWGWIEGPIHQ
ncbi:hypothetical protein PLESTB_000404800 [Pleodorina starrii]|uniref:Apple domain-containing protein n=1 Tax=Pleodorina starrii TaxID=330485 RepID=A0A9W6BFP7_9CHLO|nr:hypothetical protein PLESTB_000404800 [Pleodorina starrii]